MLHFIPPVPENEELDSMVGKLKYMDENITILQSENQNWVVKDLLIEQQTKRNKLQIRISKVQKQQQKEQAKLAKAIARESGEPDKENQLLTKSETLFAEFGVILGGWWLAIKNMFIKSNSNKNIISRMLKGDNSDFQERISEYKYRSIEESSTKSIKKGLIYSIISLIAFSCIGSIFFAIISSIFSIENANFTSGFLMLIIFFVFLISQKIFINQSFGLVFIEGFLGIPNIRLTTNHPSHGITNKVLVKSLVGIFTFISVGSLILSVLLFLPLTNQEELPDLAVLVLLLGFMISPVFAIFAGIRTKVVDISQIE